MLLQTQMPILPPFITSPGDPWLDGVIITILSEAVSSSCEVISKLFSSGLDYICYLGQLNGHIHPSA